jgi:hypothetical protein
MKRKRRNVTVQAPFGVGLAKLLDTPAVLTAADGVP